MKESYVVLGGWARNSETYRKLVEIAPKENDVYVIPHTSLIPDTKIPTIDNISEKILHDLKQKNLTYITLIGHSLGGALAISFAANHPEYVKKLILVDSEGIPDNRNFSSVALSLLKDYIFIHGSVKSKENIKATIRVIQKFPYYLAMGHFAHNINVQQEAQKVKTPTLILCGEKDNVVPLKSAKELNRLIKGSKLIILKGMDHDWLIHNPKALWNNIEK